MDEGSIRRRLESGGVVVHDVTRVDRDGRRWFVVFLAGTLFQHDRAVALLGDLPVKVAADPRRAVLHVIPDGDSASSSP